MPLKIIKTTWNDRLVVTVPLDNELIKRVMLDERSFNELLDRGIPLPWRHYKRRVMVHNHDRYFTLARLITDAGPGQSVEYLDGDPFNLCMPNLIVTRKAT